MQYTLVQIGLLSFERVLAMKFEDYTPEMRNVNGAYLEILNAHEALVGGCFGPISPDNARHWLALAQARLRQMLNEMEAARSKAGEA